MCGYVQQAQVVFNKDSSHRSYLNLQLSYRGSERQPPSCLSLALTFSSVLLEKSQNGEHDASLNTENRLRLATDEFNSQPGMIQRWRVDEDRFKACLNLIVGTTPGARCLIQHHLNFHKWQLSCFTAELLRSTRWLLGASPRATCSAGGEAICGQGDVDRGQGGARELFAEPYFLVLCARQEDEGFSTIKIETISGRVGQVGRLHMCHAVCAQAGCPDPPTC